LALVSDGSGVAANVLQNLGLHAAKIVMEVERLADRGSGRPPVGELPQTASAESVIESAIDEARNLNHNYVGTEHILLGLLREEKAIAAQVLKNLGLNLEAARTETVRLLCHPEDTEEPPQSSGMPGTDAEREFFLRLYQSAVDFYKPRIEKRTGVALGRIAVWDHSQLHRDVLKVLRRQTGPRVVGFFRSLALRRRLRRYSQTIAAEYADHARACAARYFRNAVYVSFDSNTAHEQGLAMNAVHELAHVLWERLEGEPLDAKWLTGRLAEKGMEEFRVLVEGYATYAERIWFLDLYPIGLRQDVQRSPLDPASIRSRGLRRVQELVEQHGPEILLKIPQQWRDL